jgi:hypothetical protein
MPGDYWSRDTETITLGRDTAIELLGAVKDLGAWLETAPEHIRARFATHAFPDPTIPGANTEEFLLAAFDAWDHLNEAVNPDPAVCYGSRTS